MSLSLFADVVRASHRLMRRVRATERTMEYEQAGHAYRRQATGKSAGAEIDELYLSWGFKSIEGLELDGREPRYRFVDCSQGPRGLCREIIAAIKRECSLLKKNEKTNCRLSLSICQPGRMEVRRMPIKRPG